MFTPDRLAVVKGGPATRRAYLDRAVGRLLPARATLAERVRERARAAKRRTPPRPRGRSSTRAALAPWTAKVVDARRGARRAPDVDAIELLAPPFAQTAASSAWRRRRSRYDGEPPTANDLAARIDTDLERGVTGVGPHLHDLRIEAGEPRSAVVRLAGRAADGRARARPRRGRCAPRALRRLAARAARRRAFGARRRSPPLAGATCSSAASQTVITATATAALPVEPAQALAVTPGEVR